MTKKFGSLTLLLAIYMISGCRTPNTSASLQELAIATDYIDIPVISNISQSPGFSEFLRSKLESARVVGLGEVVHGSGGLHNAIAEVGRSLIENDGYSAIAIESPWVGVRTLDKYFEDCAKGSVGKSPSVTVFPQFTTRELSELYKWICDFNSRNPEKRTIAFGFDIQQGGIVPNQLQDEPELSMQLSKIRKLASIPADLQIDQCGLRIADAAIYQRCKHSFAILNEKVRANKFQIVTQLGNDFFQNLVARVVSLSNWVEYSFQQVQKDFYQSGTARDKGMAEMFQLMDSHFGQRKTLIIAHLGHIARNAIYDGSKFNPNYENMGSFLERDSSLSIKIVGFAAKGIKCNPQLCVEQPYKIPAEYHSFWSENILSEKLSGNALLELKSSNLLDPVSPHFIGGAFGILKDNFDLLFYLRESPAANQ